VIIFEQLRLFDDKCVKINLELMKLQRAIRNIRSEILEIIRKEKNV